ncbi:hypothetical protein [Pseudomonas chlororaphis]
MKTTEQINLTTISRVQQRILMITNAANGQAAEIASRVAYGYLLALRDEGLIDSGTFAELDEQIHEVTCEYIANGLVEEGALVIGDDGEKYWADDSQVSR